MDIHVKLQYAKAVIYVTLSMVDNLTVFFFHFHRLTFFFQTSDIIIVYRCWVLCEYKPTPVALPSFFCVATAGILNFFRE